MKEGEPLFSETTTHVEIRDDGAGEFVQLIQEGGNIQTKSITINPEEWPVLREAVDEMVGLREDEKQKAKA
jgi:hypothetical protein